MAESRSTKSKKTPERKTLPTKTIHPIVQSMAHLSPSRSKFRQFAIILFGIVLLVFFLYRNKQWFIVAVVNGKPITRWELNDELMKRYGARTLDNMISERLVEDEIRKQRVVINETELNGKIDELTKSLPQGMNVEEALRAQGMTKDQFQKQLRLQLSVDKLLSQEVSMSAQEVEDYIKKNRQTLPATDPAKLTQQVEDLLRRQKVEELFQGWFASLKEKASIQRFL